MHILIDNKSGAPIYDQIYTQIKQQIIAGHLAPHEMLPSIRALAKDLRISFITTKRAYEELEKDGLVLDRQTVKFGFRTIEFNTTEGCLLNGNPVKLSLSLLFVNAIVFSSKMFSLLSISIFNFLST